MGHRNSAATPKRNMVTSAGARVVFIGRRVATDQPDQISATARAHNTPPLFSAGVNDGVAVVVMTPPCCAVLGWCQSHLHWPAPSAWLARTVRHWPGQWVATGRAAAPLPRPN